MTCTNNNRNTCKTLTISKYFCWDLTPVGFGSVRFCAFHAKKSNTPNIQPEIQTNSDFLLTLRECAHHFRLKNIPETEFGHRHARTRTIATFSSPRLTT